MKRLPPKSACELAPRLYGILTAGIEDAAARKKLLTHINHCPFCLLEMERLIHLKSLERKHAIKEGFKDFAMGLGVLALAAAFGGMRGIVANQNQAAADMGLQPPPWFKPIRKGPG